MKFTNKVNMAIMISGRGSNMESILNEVENGVLTGLVDIRAVFSDNKTARGLNIALNRGYNAFYIKQYYKNREKGERQIIDLFKKLDIELIILAGYMRILSPYFVNEFKDRILNIHPADTNEYKGMHGYEYTYNNNLKYGYITVHLVNEEVDSGKILLQKRFTIPQKSTLKRIKDKGLKIEHKIYPLAIKKFILNGFK